jgi:hypothetical protein
MTKNISDSDTSSYNHLALRHRRNADEMKLINRVKKMLSGAEVFELSKLEAMYAYLRYNPSLTLGPEAKLLLNNLAEKHELGPGDIKNLASNGLAPLTEREESPLDKMAHPLHPPGWPNNVMHYKRGSTFYSDYNPL